MIGVLTVGVLTVSVLRVGVLTVSVLRVGVLVVTVLTVDVLVVTVLTVDVLVVTVLTVATGFLGNIGFGGAGGCGSSSLSSSSSSSSASSCSSSHLFVLGLNLNLNSRFGAGAETFAARASSPGPIIRSDRLSSTLELPRILLCFVAGMRPLGIAFGSFDSLSIWTRFTGVGPPVLSADFGGISLSLSLKMFLSA